MISSCLCTWPGSIGTILINTWPMQWKLYYSIALSRFACRSNHILLFSTNLTRMTFFSDSTEFLNELRQAKFCHILIDESQIFATSELLFASVNIKPVIPGYSLVIPRRVVERVGDLTTEELCDLWVWACGVSGILTKAYSAGSFTFCIQIQNFRPMRSAVKSGMIVLINYNLKK
eukprot:795311_1